MSKLVVKRVKVKYPDVTDDNVVWAAGMVPGLAILAGRVRHILPKGRDE